VHLWMPPPKNSNKTQVISLPAPPSHTLLIVQQEPPLLLWREGLALILLIAICLQVCSVSRSYEKIWGEGVRGYVCCSRPHPNLISLDQRPECKWNV
jgi:hypothetical protein